MNLFLVAAVPLAAVILHRIFYPSRTLGKPRSWILGFVYSMLALVAVTPFSKLREFGGSLLGSGAALTLTDALLVPGALVLLWCLTRPERDEWELGLWLAMVFSMAGVRDFVSTMRTFDLNEYFLVPFDRILLLLVLPSVVGLALRAVTKLNLTLGWTAVGLLLLSGPIFQVLSFAGWGWVVWIVEAAGIGAALWWRWPRQAPSPAISEDRPEQP